MSSIELVTSSSFSLENDDWGKEKERRYDAIAERLLDHYDIIYQTPGVKWEEIDVFLLGEHHDNEKCHRINGVFIKTLGGKHATVFLECVPSLSHPDKTLWNKETLKTRGLDDESNALLGWDASEEIMAIHYLEKGVIKDLLNELNEILADNDLEVLTAELSQQEEELLKDLAALEETRLSLEKRDGALKKANEEIQKERAALRSENFLFQISIDLAEKHKEFEKREQENLSLQNALEFEKLNLKINTLTVHLKTLLIELFREEISAIKAIPANKLTLEKLLAQGIMELPEPLDFTFPARTQAMVDTLKALRSNNSRNHINPKVFFIAGTAHLQTSPREQTEPYDLSILYQELSHHKAAILIPKECRIAEATWDFIRQITEKALAKNLFSKQIDPLTRSNFLTALIIQEFSKNGWFVVTDEQLASLQESLYEEFFDYENFSYKDLPDQNVIEAILELVLEPIFLSHTDCLRIIFLGSSDAQTSNIL